MPERGGQVDEGERNLTAALPLVTNPKIHNQILLNLVDIEFSRGALQQASSNLADLMKTEPANPDFFCLAFRVYTDLADSARDELTIAAPDSARIHLLMAERFIRDGDATLAIHQYQEALAEDPSLPGVYFELGQAYLKQSLDETSLARAETELQRALKENPRIAGAEGKLGLSKSFAATQISLKNTSPGLSPSKAIR